MWLNDLQVGNVIEAQMFIDGEFTKGDAKSTISVDNPANENIIARIPEGTPTDAESALSVATSAQKVWSRKPAAERAAFVRKMALEIERQHDYLASIITAEQGKPFQEAQGEVKATAAFLHFAANNAYRLEGDIIPSDNRNEELWIHRVPYGVVVGLTAWNYPCALVARKLGPALVAGNSFVLLAHENTPLSGLALAKIARDVGLPNGVFNVVTGRGAVVGQTLVESPHSDLVTLTGSTRAGRQILTTAAERIKAVRLELGGKAPFIVMEDADLEKAVDAAVIARFTNAGQICTCNERMYLHQAIADEFLDKFIEKCRALTMGDPMTNVSLGPKVSRVERDKVQNLVEQGLEAGAEYLLKGGPQACGDLEKGYWFAPSILEVKNNQNPLMQKEIFGPAIPALRVSDFDEAIEHANDSDFGLSAYVFTQKISRLMGLSASLKVGEIYFNRANGEQVQGFHNGWRQSGLGGEDGKYGLDEYMKKQTLYLNWQD
ncbi:aldehyde dehydrogenase [Enterovibrio sp. ZSDZ35]|uniref:Aldehyde dehydrogenase n=1 Tax=Enterovibrio qingdaonensis TaxID=2899818 RepID=A0ABT5QP76_9GAMM|nr:aldehyde dehydrogenase [Enterovibrio sp. ZSDZ35]MDD1782782.1 aldehyde dehydrogenase [Enterovibrio sp. ZSDZ35]